MTVDEIIAAAGGVGKLAKLAGVSHSSVCDWRRASRVPVERALVIHELLKIPLTEIRPDIWAAAPIRPPRNAAA
jgi:DNA-binding transcriptional regulator YdaS (Cro superfamily)